MTTQGRRVNPGKLTGLAVFRVCPQSLWDSENAIFRYYEGLSSMRTTEISHFYLGHVTDSARFSRFLAEHYCEDDSQPISEFYGSQGELFCDHDFMETGERQPGNSLEEFFAPYSYSDKWSTTLCQAARGANLEDANVLIFINEEQIKSPRSVREDGFQLAYIGLIEYSIWETN